MKIPFFLVISILNSGQSVPVSKVSLIGINHSVYVVRIEKQDILVGPSLGLRDWINSSVLGPTPLSHSLGFVSVTYFPTLRRYLFKTTNESLIGIPVG